jgi:DNA-binding NarL/FixJ family response regulator
MAGNKFSQIAACLGCNPLTVRGRACGIYNKLGADNRIQAFLFDTDMGILDPLAFYGS